MEHKILKRYPIGNKRFNWKQKEYVLSTFSGFPQHKSHVGEESVVADKFAKHLKEAGFNMVELGWVHHEGSWAAVDACEKYGLDLVFQDMSLMGGQAGFNAERSVSQEVIDSVVNKLKDKKHTIGYYVWDEPQTKEQLIEARKQMDKFEIADPDAFLFTVIGPDYNFLGDEVGYAWENGTFRPHLSEFAEKMDPPVLSFDYYPVGDYFGAWPGHRYSYKNQLDDSFLLLTMAAVRDEAKKRNIPLWYYYQGFKLYDCTKAEDFIFPMVRSLMYAGVLYGVKGLQNYAAGEVGSQLMNPDGSKGQFFEEQKQIHSELKNLGNTLMALDSKLIIHSADLLPGCEYTKPYFNSIDDSSIFDGELPKRTSIGELEDEYGNRYAVIWNRDYERELETILTLKGDFRIYEVSKTDGKQRMTFDSISELPVKLNPGDAMLIRIQKSEDEAYTIEYKLED